MKKLCLFFLLFLPVFFPVSAQADDWTQARNDKANGVRVYLRDTPDSAYKNFYAITRVKASLASVLAVFADVPAMPQWISRLSSTSVVKQASDKELWIYGVYTLPEPFMQREVVLHSTVKPDKNGVALISLKADPGLVPNARKRVRLLNMQSIWRLTPEKNGVVKIEVWGRGDPGGYIPSVLFNYKLPDEPAQTLRNLQRMLKRTKYSSTRPAQHHEP
jgi:hypothetical protein